MIREIDKLTRLMELANRFYLEAEAPDEEAMDSLFFYLATHNVSRLEELCRKWDVRTEKET